MGEPFNSEAYTSDSKQNWTSAAEYYDRMSSRLFTPITESFLSFIELKPGQIVLDVACGSGQLTTAAAKAVAPSGRAVGVDLAPGMLKIAMSRATAGALEYREMDAQALDFPDELFDAVLSQLGLMLFAKPEVALKEMIRVCKIGGLVSCLVQGDPDRMLFTSLVMKTLFRRAPELKQPGAPGIYAFAPVGILEKFFTDAGLTQVLSGRAAGTFRFASPQDYWQTMTQAGGRTGALLRSLAKNVQAAVEQDVLEQAGQYIVEDRLEIPFEVVMAKGRKP